MKKFLLAVAACVLLSACGAGSTLVMQPYDGEAKSYPAAEIIHDKDTVAVPDEIASKFAEQMDEQFFEKGVFQSGKGLKVRYSFIQFEGGSQFSRWFWGGIGNSGEASVTAKVIFTTPDDERLSEVQVRGKIGSGFFGGSLSEALGKAAREASEYAAANFH